MDYKFVINDFEGPLDLLLHLVKTSEMDIYDISVEKITEQYLEFIRRMEEMNLTVASEYLVMAAELIELKSRLLLPNSKNDEDDEYEEDPREVLIERLLAYKKYKEVTSEFKDLELTRKLVFTKEPVNLSSYAKEEDIKEDLGVDDLINAFNILMQKKELDKPLATKITKKELSVSEKVKKIKDILKVRKKMNFEEVFEVQSKEEVIISFLSILEMVKKKEILLTQEGNFKSIIISLREGD